MRGDLDIRVLGPVEISDASGPLPLRGRHGRLIVCALVLDLNRAVSIDRLIDVLWGDQPPPSAVNTLQSSISRVRKVLGSDGVVRRDHSYSLEAQPDQIDLCRFESLLSDATVAAGDDAARTRALCREALDLWRGPPFGDLGEEPFLQLEGHRLEEMRIAVMELHLTADLELGRHGQVMGTLEAAVADHPYRERLWLLLLKALSHEGRRIEAMDRYGELRELLDEVGAEPGRELEAVRAEILSGG